MNWFTKGTDKLIVISNDWNQDLAVERICVEFKCAVRQNKFFFLSHENKKIIGFNNCKSIWFDLAIEKLKLLGYDGFSHGMRSCVHGTYTALVWDTDVDQEAIALQVAQQLNSY